jgi:flagellar protein FlaG
MQIRPLDFNAPPSVTADGGVSAGAPAEPSVAVVPPPPSRAEVQAAVDRANASLSTMDHALEFTIDPDTRAVVVRLIDRQDNRVLRQVPSPEMLAIAKALDRMQGMLLQSRA